MGERMRKPAAVIRCAQSTGLSLATTVIGLLHVTIATRRATHTTTTMTPRGIVTVGGAGRRGVTVTAITTGSWYARLYATNA